MNQLYPGQKSTIMDIDRKDITVAQQRLLCLPISYWYDSEQRCLYDIQRQAHSVDVEEHQYVAVAIGYTEAMQHFANSDAFVREKSPRCSRDNPEDKALSIY